MASSSNGVVSEEGEMNDDRRIEHVRKGQCDVWKEQLVIMHHLTKKTDELWTELGCDVGSSDSEDEDE